MSANAKRWILIVSLAFNAATLAGIVYGGYFANASASADPGLAPVWKAVNMTAAQRDAMQQANGKVRDQILTERERYHQKWLEGVELLAAPQIDWPAVQAKQAEISQAGNRYQDTFFQVWIDRARLLDAGQRAMLFPPIEEQIKSGKFFNWHPPARSQAGSK